MTKPRAAYYYLVIEANGVSETVKASPIKQTAISLAETYCVKHRGHRVSVRMEQVNAKTGEVELVEVWTSKGAVIKPTQGFGRGYPPRR